VLWRSRHEEPKIDDAGEVERRPFRTVAGAAFATVIVAELGDLTQLTIAGMSARSETRLAVFLGGLLALWSVAALATTVGQTLLRRLPTRALHTGAAVVFGLLAVASIVGAMSA
jgi:Ca2+/H+ antiporter, TMEM165/GDT1 family